MKSMLAKGLGIGVGVGLTIYLTGLLLDCKEKACIDNERDTFGTGK